MNDTSSSLVRIARRLFILGTSCAAVTAAQAWQSALSETAVPLDRYVFSASRTPQELKYTPSSVSVLSLPELREAQITSLSTALAMQPGVIITNTGAPGGQSSVMLRGANSDQTLFIVDGVRMNDRSTAYFNFLGAADLGGVDRIEVLRGPQSTLYGSSAMGGVIRIDTERGSGAMTGVLSGTVGSFETYGAGATVKGATGSLAYSAAVGHFETANDRPNDQLDQWAYSTRLEYALSPALLVGATYRGLSAEHDEPGSRIFPWAGNVQSGNTLVTAYAEARSGDTFTSRLTLASHRRQYTWRSTGTYAPQYNRREVADWQNTWAPAKGVELVAGANAERSRYTLDGHTEKDRMSAGYLSATVRPASTVTLTGGVRYDDFRSVGTARTGRLGAAWLPATGTKLHATYGTGFNAPGTSDRYGVPSWGQVANPNLVPEKSKGWDAGIEQAFGSAVTVDLTYFQNKFRNLFDWEYVSFVTWEGRTVNRAHASTRGVELASTFRLNTRVQARASYTYLDARDDDTEARLTRRPRHTGDAEVRVLATAPWLIGAGVHLVSANMDGANPFGGYTTARLFTSYALRKELLLKLRIENALDRSYEEIVGYPALPRGVYGSVEWRF